MNSLIAFCTIVSIAGAGLIGWFHDKVVAGQQRKRFQSVWVTAYYAVTSIAYMVSYITLDKSDVLESIFGAAFIALLLVGTELLAYSVVRALHRCYLDSDIEMEASIARTKGRKISDRTYGEMPEVIMIDRTTDRCLHCYETERLIKEQWDKKFPQLPEFKNSLEGFTTPTLENTATKDLSGIELNPPRVEEVELRKPSFLQSSQMEKIVEQASAECRSDLQDMLKDYSVEALKLIAAAMGERTLGNAG